MEHIWFLNNADPILMGIVMIIIISFFLFAGIYFGLEWAENKYHFNLRQRLKTFGDNIVFLLLYFIIIFILDCLVDLCFMQDVKWQFNLGLSAFGALIVGIVISIRK